MKRTLGLNLMVIALLGASAARGQQDARSKTAEQDKSAIETTIKSYVVAFNRGDAKALAAHWSPDAVYTSRLNGESITGRDNLEQEFSSLFKQLKGAKLAVTTESIEFISPNVALEQGMATIVRTDADPERSSYRVVHVRRDGKWLIDRVSEEEVAARPHHQQLKDLEWMTGDWIDQDGGSVIKTQCHWTRNKNFLVRSFTATVEDRINLTGMQVIGWDASRKQIRSWVFDSEGGLAEGVWKRSGDHFLVQTKATLPDGTQASSTSVLRPAGEDRFTWQKINRVVDGEILPNINEVVIVRQEK